MTIKQFYIFCVQSEPVLPYVLYISGSSGWTTYSTPSVVGTVVESLSDSSGWNLYTSTNLVDTFIESLSDSSGWTLHYGT